MPEGMPSTPLAVALGRRGDPVACKTISDDISVHWWATVWAADGTPCLCGKRVKVNPS